MKLLVVGVILLFLGVTIAPTINHLSVKASQETEYVDVTVSPCGLKGFRNNTIRLTKQQYQDFEKYFADFQGRLNQTETREEAVPLFKDAVIELNKYGLLPKHMSIQAVQDLVTGKHPRMPLNSFGERKSRPDGIVNTYAFMFSYGELEEKYSLLLLLIYFWDLMHPNYNPHFFLYVVSQLNPFNLYSIMLFKSGYIFSIGTMGIDFSTGPFGFMGFVGLSITTKVDYIFPVKMFCLGWSQEIGATTGDDVK